MKNLWIAFAFAASPAAAQSWHPFASIDYFATGNLIKHANDVCGRFSAFESCSASQDGALGGRIGIFHSWSLIDLGASLGYVAGGPGEAQYVFSGFNGEYQDRTLRFLVEAREKIIGNEQARLYLNAGLGMADIKENFSINGSPKTWYPAMGWATWEIGPSFWFHHFDLAIRYAGFARGGFLPWNTEEFSLGYEF